MFYTCCLIFCCVAVKVADRTWCLSDNPKINGGGFPSKCLVAYRTLRILKIRSSVGFCLFRLFCLLGSPAGWIPHPGFGTGKTNYNALFPFSNDFKNRWGGGVQFSAWYALCGKAPYNVSIINLTICLLKTVRIIKSNKVFACKLRFL